ncbi:hypothetical protein [Borrelia crocidurae]|uniref:Membrane associated protein n=1 Tax=Borrelia crocidurae (strain Achema) TaxID=1155096 RepID=I0FC08_BORCA|nr:hypothetical protein Q7M_235 [Borrelia crocidurae str. Achema]
MKELFFYKIRLLFIFCLNISFSIYYMLLYRSSFSIFIIFLMFINFFVMVSYLRYFYEIDFKGNKIFYKKFCFKVNFDFHDIIWIEKRLLDNMLILGLNNGTKIKMCFLRKEYLSSFFKKLKLIRSDLFITKIQELPIRYHVSGTYILMYLFRVLINVFVYYISFGSIIVFSLVLILGIKVLIRDILVLKNLVIFYEFRQNSVYERKLFSGKEYYYEFFNKIFVYNSELTGDGYLSFVYPYKSIFKKVYINDKGMSYSMKKVFAYIDKYCNKCS